MNDKREVKYIWMFKISLGSPIPVTTSMFELRNILKA